MTNVYIALGRIIPEDRVDKQLERICAQADIKDFQEKHPIIGTLLSPILYLHFKKQYTK